MNEDSYEYNDYDSYRPEGTNIMGPFGGDMGMPSLGTPPFGQQPQFGGSPFGQQPPFGGPPFGQQPPAGAPPFGQQPPLGMPPFGQQPPFGVPPFGKKPPFGVGGEKFGAPSGPPPTFIPKKSLGGAAIFAVDPGAIRPCRFRYIYLWLNTGENFWAWLTFVGPRSAAGFRWTGFRWIYFGVDLDNIETFYCY